MKKSLKRKYFTEKLLLWNNNENMRIMPWKGEKDPYRIWLSEVILQQTRVKQGEEYYHKFLKKFPNILRLASATENEVFKLWEGLGYYSRCRNLLVTAREIAFSRGGKFPTDHQDILKLKGVGPYTAAAISSFAYELPFAVTDANVFRLLARFFGITKSTNSSEGKKYFTDLSQTLLDKSFPAIYNQAIMDFGAIICKPKQPLCPQCTFQLECTAFRKGLIGSLPLKEKKITRKQRYFFYIIAEHGDAVYTRQRAGKDIWQGLTEFILVEKNVKVPAEKLLRSSEFLSLVGSYKLIHISKAFRQQLTHQIIEGVFIHIQLQAVLKDASYTAVNKKQLLKKAFPRLINTFLEQEKSGREAMTGFFAK